MEIVLYILLGICSLPFIFIVMCLAIMILIFAFYLIILAFCLIIMILFIPISYIHYVITNRKFNGWLEYIKNKQSESDKEK